MTSQRSNPQEIWLTVVILTMLCVFFLTMSGCGNNEPTLSQNESYYAGCYTDEPIRALPAFLLQGNATVEACIDLARDNGFAYAGVQYGGQCFAGNTLGYTKVPDSYCNMPCYLYTDEICGGTWANSVYTTGI